jgi:glycerol-3-phosphate dehydrogenase (NAD(P)+)
VKTKVSVFGAGTWGTALAQSLARSGHEVCLWCHKEKEAEKINGSRYNPSYLTEYQLLPQIHATGSLQTACKSSALWLFAIPTQHLRSLLNTAKAYFNCDIKIANAAKGMEIDTLKLISQIVQEIIPGASYTVISGPSHAEEAIRNLPLAVVAASDDQNSAKLWQELLNRDTFRVYTNSDVTGVEVGGAVKNIIAIASGLLQSMKMGDNSTAAMVTRGLAEIVRLGTALGAKPQTFLGLAGIGDLMVTAYSRHSRNFRFGELLGEGMKVDEAVRSLGQVVEGIYTVKAVKVLSERLSVDMPISAAVYDVLYQNLDLNTAMQNLLNRAPKPETRDQWIYKQNTQN